MKPGCTGPCHQGDLPCRTPQACRIWEEMEREDLALPRALLSWPMAVSAATVVAIVFLVWWSLQ